jgi:putative tryptophan/tyrosine transport system substrate-binding protein
MSRAFKIVGSMAVLLVLALSAALLAACGSSSSSGSTTSASPSTAAKSYKIGVTQIVTHPALDASVQGFKDQLVKEGIKATYDMQNAEGDMATATSIAQKFAGENLDLIFSVATPVSQACAKATTTIPIVFCAVTDPVGAGLVKNLNAPSANVTGTSDMQPVKPILELVKLVPGAKAVGALYNAGESNSVFLVTQEEKVAKQMGYTLVKATASNSSEVQAAAQSLVGKVQAITVIGDNTIVSALESVIKICQQNKILLLAGDPDSVKRGAAAAFGFDYEDIGRQAGSQAAKILTGTAVKDVPVEFAKNLQLSINQASAKKMGVTLPAALVAKAKLKY